MTTSEHKHYHLIGIGGVGMGPLASLLLARGHRVTGSDVRDNAMTALLREQGAEIAIGHSAQHITSPDVVVYSSSISGDNPELQAGRERAGSVIRRAQLLADLMRDHTSITVAGAHGKTTTTSMISSLLILAGRNPTTAVGGTISGTSWHAAVGKGPYFVAEVDESDGSFLYFTPDYSVITNVDWDHVDYYPGWEAIMTAYRQFIGQTRPDGTLMACADDPRLQELLKGFDRRIRTYGLNSADVAARDIRLEKDYSIFHVEEYGYDLGEMTIRLPGRHNVCNALASVAVGRELGIPFDTIAHALGEFRGVQRRFQVKGHCGGVCVVDDYGHHPGEIRATLAAAQKYKDRRLITVFQPHRYSRTGRLADDFVEALQDTDELVITDIYAASEKPIPGVTSQMLVERLQARGRKVTCVPLEDIANFLSHQVREGDLVLTLGAGDIYKAGEQLLSILDGASTVKPARGNG